MDLIFSLEVTPSVKKLYLLLNSVVAYGRKPESGQNLSQHTHSGSEYTADVTS
jgi:hypothetical protein